MTGLSEKDRLRLALRWALDWIDAVPPSTPLPTMPGFDRDYVDALLQAARSEGQGEPVVRPPIPLVHAPDGAQHKVSYVFGSHEDAAAFRERVWRAYTSPPDPQARIEALEKALTDARRYLEDLSENLSRNDADMVIDHCEEPLMVANRLRSTLAALNPQATDQAATKGGEHGGK